MPCALLIYLCRGGVAWRGVGVLCVCVFILPRLCHPPHVPCAPLHRSSRTASSQNHVCARTGSSSRLSHIITFMYCTYCVQINTLFLFYFILCIPRISLPDWFCFCLSELSTLREYHTVFLQYIWYVVTFITSRWSEFSLQGRGVFPTSWEVVSWGFPFHPISERKKKKEKRKKKPPEGHYGVSYRQSVFSSRDSPRLTLRQDMYVSYVYGDLIC